MANEDIKKYARVNDVPLWAIGEKMGFIYDTAFSRKLRHELSPEEKARFKSIVDELTGKIKINMGGHPRILDSEKVTAENSNHKQCRKAHEMVEDRLHCDVCGLEKIITGHWDEINFCPRCGTKIE